MGDRQLGLNENMLSSLPAEIGSLANLEILDLRYNRLEEVSCFSKVVIDPVL